MTKELLVRFPDVSSAQASIWAHELSDRLSRFDRRISAETRRDDPMALDFGSTLAILLAAPATVALGKGLGEGIAKVIGDWLGTKQDAKLSIVRPDGSLVIENISAKDAIRLARELSKETGND